MNWILKSIVHIFWSTKLLIKSAPSLFYVPKITSSWRITQIFVFSLFCTNLACDLAKTRWSDADMGMLKTVVQREMPLQSCVLHSPLCSLVFLGKCGKDLSLSMKGRCPPIVRRDNDVIQDSSCTLYLTEIQHSRLLRMSRIKHELMPICRRDSIPT